MTTKTNTQELPTSLGKTKVQAMAPRSIVGKATGFIAAYDGVINPYSGCSFGCDYCYASNFTQTEAERETWGQWVKVKTNAVERFHEIAPGHLNNKVFYMSTATDPYQPVEKTAGVTRALLEAMAERKPTINLVIQTRSPLVVRDLDVLSQLKDQGSQIQVNMTVTTDDDQVRKTYEPGCPSIAARLKAITKVQESGIQACITMTPLLPLSDAQGFAETVKSTGATRFIVQGFHLLQDRIGEKMIARTDDRAIMSTAEHFGCPKEEAPARYTRKFREDLAVLKKNIPGLTFGKDGFAPPF